MWVLVMRKILIGSLIFLIILLVGCTPQSQIVDANKVMEDKSDSTDNKPDSVISGNQYVKYEKEEYEKSLAEGKVVLLDFYANWCPICRSENPKIRQGLSELNDLNVIAYQVHYNDNQVSEDEKDLAREYGITYQHTKVILKNGKVVLKSLEAWDKEKTIEELRKVL